MASQMSAMSGMSRNVIDGNRTKRGFDITASRSTRRVMVNSARHPHFDVCRRGGNRVLRRGIGRPPVPTPPPPTTAPTPPPSPPPTPAPTPPPPPPTPKPTTTPTTTTKEPERTRRELICTVGDTAVEDKMYPTDGLCHYLYYTHVYIIDVERKFYVRGKRIPASFTVFKEAVKKYSKTEAGLSFDVKAVNSTIVGWARDDIKKLEANRILHYGTLNVIHEARRLRGLVTRAVGMTKALKQLQNNDNKRRTVVAIRAIDYATDDKWNMLKNAVKQAANQNTGIDTVIIISSFSSWLGEMKDCKSVPPNIINGDKAFPSLDKTMEMVDKASEALYSNKDVVAGLSLEMGTMMYTYEGAQSDPLGSYAYKECKTATLMPLDQGCESKTRKKIADVNVAFGENAKEVVLFFDDSATLKEKIEFVLGNKLRRRFAWLYFDVHMADFREQCGSKDPFQLIQTLRSDFGINDDPDQTS
ncbi:hypothetical protein MTO96_028473 [Rhipicephalus appendiculatus]